ncbi:MAG: CAF17-like 4Fe-4S cluster assembly/insertion protein YgfZ [Frankiaceae bacterium]
MGQNSTYRSPLLDHTGAVAADPPDAGVAAHYGDPLREQRRLAESAAVVDRSHRGVLRVGGPDRLSWLHSLTTQHLEALAPWSATQALVLSPHGHVEHDLRVCDDGEVTWLDVEPGTAAGLLAFLESMRFLLRVEPRDVTAQWAVLSAAGADLPGRLELPAPGRARRDGELLIRRPAPGDPAQPTAVDLLVPRAEFPAVADRLAPLAGVGAYEALRVAAGAPRLGRDTDHRTIPHEVGWLPTAVHLEKGCYRGQETGARVHNLGRPPRRLVLLHLDGSTGQLPAQAAAVSWQGRVVGFVGTAAWHYELGPVALAVVKRAVPDGASLDVDGYPALVEPLPGLAEGDLARASRP